MADQLPDSPDIKAGIAAFRLMDRSQVVAEGIRTFQIGVDKIPGVADAFEIAGVRRAFSELRQCEKLFNVTERYKTLIPAENTHIDGRNMARKPVKGAMVPKETLRPVGHMLVPERARPDRVHDSLAA